LKKSEIRFFDKIDGEDINGACVPKFAPGLEFYNSESDTSMCDLGDRVCTIRYKKKASGFLGEAGDQDWEINDNNEKCESDTGQWIQERNNFCSALGDCGASVNYLGFESYDDLQDLYTISDRLDRSQKDRRLQELVSGGDNE